MSDRMAKALPDPVHIIHNPSGPVTALASLKRNENSPSTLVSGSDNGVITIWTLDNYRSSKSWQAHSSCIVWLGADDNLPGWLLSHGRSESVMIWSPEGEKVHEILVNHEGFCKCNLWMNLLAIPVGKNAIDVYEIKDHLHESQGSMKSFYPPERKGTLAVSDDEGGLMAVKWLNRSRAMVAAYESGFVCVWQENVMVEQTRVKSMPTCLEYHAQRNEILLGTSSETLYIFNVDKLVQLEAIALTNPGLNAITLRQSDCRIYATAGWDKRIRLFNAKNHKKLCVLQLHDDSLNSLVFMAGHCGLLAAGSSDALISLWQLYSDGHHQNT